MTDRTEFSLYGPAAKIPGGSKNLHGEIVMEQSITERRVHREPWTKGKLVVQKAGLRLKEVLAIRIASSSGSERALFNLAVSCQPREHARPCRVGSGDNRHVRGWRRGAGARRRGGSAGSLACSFGHSRCIHKLCLAGRRRCRCRCRGARARRAEVLDCAP